MADARSNPSGQAAFWQDPSDGPQFAFPQAPQASFQQQPAGGNGNLWMQVMSPSAEPFAQPQQQQQQSLLPVPYQEPPAPNSLMMLPNAFPTLSPGAQGANPLLPALPEGEDAPVYVAPMYTRPRPLIPRYRAISGLISVIVVFSLLCGGTGYYLQSTGKLIFFQQLLGSYMPPKVTTQQRPFAVPDKKTLPGPGWNKPITSAAISDAADPKTGQVANYVNEFKIGQTIYITCSANTNNAGQVYVKLYTNGNYYSTLASQGVKAKTIATVIFTAIYAQAAEGKAEIYWTDAKGENSVLAVTLPFVVQPSS